MVAAPDDEPGGCGGAYRGRGALVANVKRIAVLRANAVGDLVVAMPALAALRRAYPQSRISLLARAWHRDFLDGRPSPVDEVIALPDAIDFATPLDGWQEPGASRRDDRHVDREGGSLDAPHRSAIEATTARCIAVLRERRFDIALQMHGGGRHSNPFVQALGARISAGLRAADAPPLDRNLAYRPLHPEVLRLLETVALVGAQGCEIEPRLHITEPDRREAGAALTAADPGGHCRFATGTERPLLVLQPACTDPRRAWPAESFAAVGDHFARRGACVVLNGTRAEASTLMRVRAAMREPVIDLAGVLSLGGLLGLLERARLLVSNDTGTAHLARAVDRASVTICWIGNLTSYGPTSCARHAVAVSWQLHCPRCERFNVGMRCEHDDSFVASVRTEEVLALADELWSATPANEAAGLDFKRATPPVNPPAGVAQR